MSRKRKKRRRRRNRRRRKRKKNEEVNLFLGCLAARQYAKYTSGADLLWQLHMLPH